MTTSSSRGGPLGPQCLPRLDWVGIAIGLALAVVGMGLTVTIIGALLGVPLVLLGIDSAIRSETLRGTPCGP